MTQYPWHHTLAWLKGNADSWKKTTEMLGDKYPEDHVYYQQAVDDLNRRRREIDAIVRRLMGLSEEGRLRELVTMCTDAFALATSADESATRAIADQAYGGK